MITMKAKSNTPLEIMIQENPDCAMSHNDLGVLSYQMGNKEKALACYEKAVVLEPKNSVFQKNRRRNR